MRLVLCDAGDAAALWAFAGLRARGLDGLELVCPQALVCSLRSVHRVGARDAHFEIALADGRVLDSRAVRGVLNRVSVLPLDHLGGAAAADGRYAVEEIHALVLSWLATLGAAALNRATPRGLSGAWRPPIEWTLLATRAGLPVPAVRQSSRDGFRRTGAPPIRRHTVVVLGDGVFGLELPRDLAQACVRLARLADTDLLGIDLDRLADGSLTFADATPQPDLRFGGSAFLDELHARLTGAPAGTS